MCQLLRESSRAGEGSNHLLGALQICPPGKATRCAISETAAGRRQGEQQQLSRGQGSPSVGLASVSVSVLVLVSSCRCRRRLSLGVMCVGVAGAVS